LLLAKDITGNTGIIKQQIFTDLLYFSKTC